MNSRISKGIETAANISIVVVAALGACVLLRDHILPNRGKEDVQQAKSDASISSNSNRRMETVVGESVSLPDVHWSQNGKTLLIVIAKGCHYCTESAAFYKKIAQAASGRRDIQIIAVFPHSVDEGREYLAEIQVPITEVRQASLNLIGVRGTPTILLVDNVGMVKEAWLGRLPPAKEAEVLKIAGCQECS